MPGPRQSLKVLESTGRKHLSKAERIERQGQEIEPVIPKQIRPPQYLQPALKDQFRAIAKKLKELGLLSSLDYDTLARYLLAQQSYLAATQRVFALQRQVPVDLDELDVAARIQTRFFNQARACANDLGMTITSRCRLVLPEGARKPEENAFDKLIRERQERMRRA